MMTIGTWTFQQTENSFSEISDDWDWAPFSSFKRWRVLILLIFSSWNNFIN